MPEETRDDAARARLQGKRAMLVVIGIFAFAIIGASSFQIIPAVFGAGIRPIPVSPAGSPARTCAEGVRKLERALDRAAESAGSASFEPRLQPDWQIEGAVRQACGQSSEGIDAWASLARLRSAEEQLAPRPGQELEPLRRDVLAHLPADLR
jgi:hypothetical protein